ncbi:hypothetical protein N7492_005356 [Penicillium capsulatum]|uniref:Zn(2)-C6 fungal-type domain-containing protein n=1 Tax=Penicillium capsulatum TaxID=69766 RepID=A0A9W9LS13_9EURO|nr:hypothetical protein N7492_005356 [Penicillium capsulatum]KAJ6135544.1 hypothetical protein N7512_000704 [Penicillium capsulatum]
MSNQACIRCRKQKRKCDKILPRCSLCKRLEKSCCYNLPAELPRLLPFPDGNDLTLFNLQHTLEAQVSSVVGNGKQLEDATTLYFQTVHTWFPMVAEDAHRTRLSLARVDTSPPPSDLSLLVLCMALVCKQPVGGELPSSTRSLYASLKSFGALLEAMGVNTLEMLQIRALLTVFEIGHGLYPVACISAAANASAAVALGINATEEKLYGRFQGPQRAKEARDTWHGIITTQRYTFLESGQIPYIPPYSLPGIGDSKKVSV